MVQCSNWGYVLFVRGFWDWYRRDCEVGCRCFEEEVGMGTGVDTGVGTGVGSTDSDSTWSSVGEDWAGKNAQVMREVYLGGGDVVSGRVLEQSNGSSAVGNRLSNSPGRVGKCLAGQAAGWTYENVAGRRCCPGYGFSALTASEAFVNYGIPIGDVVAGLVSVGMCLKSGKIG